MSNITLEHYQIIKKDFLHKYFELLNKYSSKKEIKYNNKSKKEIFIKRTFDKWLNNKYFVYIKFDILGYIGTEKETLPIEIKIPYRNYCHINYIEKIDNSNSLRFYLTEINKHSIFNYLDISYNDLLNLQYLEITKDYYDSVNNMFIDNRSNEEFSIIGKYIENKKVLNNTEKVLAKDRVEAIKKYNEKYQDHCIISVEQI